MIFTVNSYSGYKHEGENKLLSPHETLGQVQELEYDGLVTAVVPLFGGDQTPPLSDLDKERRRDGFVAEFTQAGVFANTETGEAMVSVFTIDVVGGGSNSDQIWLSSDDVLRKTEEVVLSPAVRDGSSPAESTSFKGGSKPIVSIAGIAMPAMEKLLVVQMMPMPA